MSRRRVESSEPVVIIIAPRRLWEELAARLEGTSSTQFFESPAELDAWRSRELHRSSIYPHVVRELEHLGCAEQTLSPRLERVFRRLCESERVPALSDLLGDLPRRTFYMAWCAELPESPRRFFERVRLRHAIWLIDRAGLSLQEAAHAAGFSHPGRFYVLRRRFMAEPAKPLHDS